MVKEIIIAVVFIVIAIAISAWYKSSQKSKGNIIDRPKDFAEYAEIFTIRPVTDQEFFDAVNRSGIKSMYPGMKIAGNTGAMYLEVGSYFKAKISHKEQTEDHSVYRFEFISWSSKHGTPEHDIEMNAVETKVEKMFLDLDPNAQVATVKNEVKTKRSLI